MSKHFLRTGTKITTLNNFIKTIKIFQQNFMKITISAVRLILIFTASFTNCNFTNETDKED